MSKREKDDVMDGFNGQDRKSYSDDQDRESYSVAQERKVGMGDIPDWKYAEEAERRHEK